MSQRLISRNADLKRLRDEGYDVTIIDGHLVLRDVPYVKADKTVALGALVSTLHLSEEQTLAPDTHVAMFAGDYPCNADGSAIAKIRHQDNVFTLGKNIAVRHSFSSKPVGGVQYRDYYEKMATYVQIISSQARALDPSVDPRTYPVITTSADESVFNYLDTASSRAGITELSNKLANHRIGIVGLGGTGSYVLDFVAKTPVREIHLFDKDLYANHNAFRSPGAPTSEELGARPSKVKYLAQVYSRMHRGIVPHEERIGTDTLDLLRGLDFVFICIDDGPSKVPIILELERLEKPFVDVGMGLEVVEGRLLGLLRVTTSTASYRDHVRSRHRIPFGSLDQPDLYAQNIQIAELNALNATLAVIRWKKLCGFYLDLEGEHFTTYSVDGNWLLNEDKQ